MAKKTVKKQNTPLISNSDKSIKIVGLILNILILPGLGTLVGGGKKYQQIGITQLVLAIVSIPLMLILIGFLTFFIVWIWGIVISIQMVQD